MKFFVWLLCIAQLSALQIETFYGPLDVEEPVLLELIESAPFQRLKQLHQYGVAYYTTHTEEYNRYDHSLGVFAILRMKGMSLEEQIAGLLHDVSHTVFSHVGDYVFEVLGNDSYQDGIHEWYLNVSGLSTILESHGYEAKGILPKSGKFPALEQELPDLCADRIDYNLQGAYYRGLFSKEDAKEVLDGLRFDGNAWIAKPSLALGKMACFSVFMSCDCWSSPRNYFASRALSRALLRAVEIGLISLDEIHFGVDDQLWEKLILSDDPEIQVSMERTLHAENYFSIDEKGDETIRGKFRGVDPLIADGIALDGIAPDARLSDSDAFFREEFTRVKMLLKRGWAIKEICK